MEERLILTRRQQTFSILFCAICFSLLTGCCGVIPGIKCSPNKILTVQWNSDELTNNSQSLQLKIMVVDNIEAFDAIPTKTVFRPERDQSAYDNLAETEVVETEFIKPGSSGFTTFNLDELDLRSTASPKYLAVIGNFARPESDAAARKTMHLNPLKFPLSITLDIAKNSLSIAETKN